MNERLMTVTDVAQRLRVSRGAIYRWAESGRLPALRVGSLLRFRETDVDAFCRPAHGDERHPE